ncbi:hypothetical protein Pst134EA_029169 [Puccinia striiformis f. sp. tritici]|uniref:hypothetical protein n=1 Tax=Puccinia striiformis f. sp. tritici TaxID=168172 RepID=UPI002008661D|nr:hypothetical protein Pst134EA_029169 [Puccinia striiformis f. sp. tritici]KAH9447129.1 hypothetical protein Pst134EA_029169 [Puccinia striiformis f. sp. tritici]
MLRLRNNLTGPNPFESTESERNSGLDQVRMSPRDRQELRAVDRSGRRDRADQGR